MIQFKFMGNPHYENKKLHKSIKKQTPFAAAAFTAGTSLYLTYELNSWAVITWILSIGLAIVSIETLNEYKSSKSFRFASIIVSTVFCILGYSLQATLSADESEKYKKLEARICTLENKNWVGEKCIDSNTSP